MGGIYKAFTKSQATGAAGVPVTLFSENIAGGSVADGNAIRLVFDGTGSAGFTVKLGTKVLFDADSEAVYDVTIYRDGTAAVVVGSARIGQTVYPVSATAIGLSWGSGQELAIIGTSNRDGGLILQRAGLQK